MADDFDANDLDAGASEPEWRDGYSALAGAVLCLAVQD